MDILGTNSIENILKLNIFSNIERNASIKIIKSLKKANIKKNTKLISKGEESDGKWYIIISWKVLIKTSNNEITLWVWEIFWEIALLNEWERTASVKSLTNLEVLVLNQEEIIEILKNKPDEINKKIMDRVEENN